MTKNLSPAGDEKLVLRGEFQLNVLAPPIDPMAHGLTLSVFDSGGALLYTRFIPHWAASPGGPGWKQNGTRWTFKDRNGILAGGIKKVILSDLSSITPGLFKLKVIGKDANFQVPAGSEPVQLEVVLGGAAERVAGQCATRAYNTSGGPRPSCETASAGDLLKCR